jgi:nitrogen PTS system EIIA component
MDLNRFQVETLLNVSSNELDNFICDKNLPFYTLGEEKRFDLVEIESWMMQHKFWESAKEALPFNLYRSLARGGFLYVEDLGDASILKLGAFCLGEKLGIDPEGLFSLLQDREKLASTAFGEGFAIPHPRERIDGIKQDTMFIVQLKNGIDFEALDHKKVHTFFFLLSGSDKSHLNLLSKLAHLIYSQKASEWIHAHASHSTILKNMLDWENEILKQHEQQKKNV